MAKRSAPEVNAGSMADIAFLLLIFFLVTTTIETNSGITTKLPPKQDTETPPPPIKQKNIFTVVVNKDNQLLVEDKLIQIKELRQATKDFVDNAGGTDAEGNKCTYCNGKRDPSSSDHPKKAVVSLQNDRGTSYATYISVQNELNAAYNELREGYAKSKFPREAGYLAMESEYNDSKTSEERKEKLKKKLEEIKKMYPRTISEAEPKKNN